MTIKIKKNHLQHVKIYEVESGMKQFRYNMAAAYYECVERCLFYNSKYKLNDKKKKEC